MVDDQTVPLLDTILGASLLIAFAVGVVAPAVLPLQREVSLVVGGAGLTLVVEALSKRQLTKSIASLRAQLASISRSEAIVRLDTESTESRLGEQERRSRYYAVCLGNLDADWWLLESRGELAAADESSRAADECAEVLSIFQSHSAAREVASRALRQPPQPVGAEEGNNHWSSLSDLTNRVVGLVHAAKGPLPSADYRLGVNTQILKWSLCVSPPPPQSMVKSAYESFETFSSSRSPILNGASIETLWAAMMNSKDHVSASERAQFFWALSALAQIRDEGTLRSLQESRQASRVLIHFQSKVVGSEIPELDEMAFEGGSMEAGRERTLGTLQGKLKNAAWFQREDPPARGAVIYVSVQSGGLFSSDKTAVPLSDRFTRLLGQASGRGADITTAARPRDSQ